MSVYSPSGKDTNEIALPTPSAARRYRSSHPSTRGSARRSPSFHRRGSAPRRCDVSPPRHYPPRVNTLYRKHDDVPPRRNDNRQVNVWFRKHAVSSCNDACKASNCSSHRDAGTPGQKVMTTMENGRRSRALSRRFSSSADRSRRRASPPPRRMGSPVKQICTDPRCNRRDTSSYPSRPFKTESSCSICHGRPSLRNKSPFNCKTCASMSSKRSSIPQVSPKRETWGFDRTSYRNHQRREEPFTNPPRPGRFSRTRSCDRYEPIRNNDKWQRQERKPRFPSSIASRISSFVSNRRSDRSVSPRRRPKIVERPVDSYSSKSSAQTSPAFRKPASDALPIRRASDRFSSEVYQCQQRDIGSQTLEAKKARAAWPAVRFADQRSSGTCTRASANQNIFDSNSKVIFDPPGMRSYLKEKHHDISTQVPDALKAAIALRQDALNLNREISTQTAVTAKVSKETYTREQIGILAQKNMITQLTAAKQFGTKQTHGTLPQQQGIHSDDSMLYEHPSVCASVKTAVETAARRQLGCLSQHQGIHSDGSVLYEQPSVSTSAKTAGETATKRHLVSLAPQREAHNEPSLYEQSTVATPITTVEGDVKRHPGSIAGQRGGHYNEPFDYGHPRAVLSDGAVDGVDTKRQQDALAQQQVEDSDEDDDEDDDDDSDDCSLHEQSFADVRVKNSGEVDTIAQRSALTQQQRERSDNSSPYERQRLATPSASGIYQRTSQPPTSESDGPGDVDEIEDNSLSQEQTNNVYIEAEPEDLVLNPATNPVVEEREGAYGVGCFEGSSNDVTLSNINSDDVSFSERPRDFDPSVKDDDLARREDDALLRSQIELDLGSQKEQKNTIDKFLLREKLLKATKRFERKTSQKVKLAEYNAKVDQLQSEKGGKRISRDEESANEVSSDESLNELVKNFKKKQKENYKNLDSSDESLNELVRNFRKKQKVKFDYPSSSEESLDDLIKNFKKKQKTNFKNPKHKSSTLTGKGKTNNVGVDGWKKHSGTSFSDLSAAERRNSQDDCCDELDNCSCISLNSTSSCREWKASLAALQVALEQQNATRRGRNGAHTIPSHFGGNRRLTSSKEKERDVKTFRRDTTHVSSDTADVPRDTADVSRDTVDVSRDTAAVSSDTADVSRDTAAVSSDTADVSRDTSDVSRDPTFVAREASFAAHDASDDSHDTTFVSRETSLVSHDTSSVWRDTSKISHETIDERANNPLQDPEQPEDGLLKSKEKGINEILDIDELLSSRRKDVVPSESRDLELVVPKLRTIEHDIDTFAHGLQPGKTPSLEPPKDSPIRDGDARDAESSFLPKLLKNLSTSRSRSPSPTFLEKERNIDSVMQLALSRLDVLSKNNGCSYSDDSLC